MKKHELTVIVPTKNENENIIPFLHSLPPDVQVIVVDASDDNTPEVIRRIRPEKTQIVFDQGNIARARQRGAEVAATEWLLYTDADMVFAKEYFEELERLELSANQGGIVGAKHSRDAYRVYYWWFSLGMRLLCWIGLPGASGSNMLIPRQAVFEAGGFDPELTCNEDSLIMWEVRRCGYRVTYCGKLKVYESDHRRLEKGMLRKTFHSLLRCALLFSGACTDALRKSDWGYWKNS